MTIRTQSAQNLVRCPLGEIAPGLVTYRLGREGNISDGDLGGDGDAGRRESRLRPVQSGWMRRGPGEWGQLVGGALA